MNRGKANKSEMDGGKANLNGGKNLMRAVGMAGKGTQAHSLLNKPLQADTAGGLSARHRPRRTNGPQLADFAANNNSHKAVLPLVVQVGGGECSRVGTQEGGCRPT